MSSFNFDKQTETTSKITNVFFVDIDVARFIKRWSLPTEHGEDFIIEVLNVAVFEVNRDLNDWALAQQEKGYASLEDVPSKMLGTVNEFVLMYETAVSYKAKSESLKMYAGVVRSEISNELIENKNMLSGSYLRSYSNAINIFLGGHTFDAELL